MSKRLLPSEPSRPPVRLRLPQISLQELKTIRVAIKRKDVPPDAAVTGPLIRSLDDPEDLILHKPDEGKRPIFDRDDIIVNLDFEERIVVATSELSSLLLPRSEEKSAASSRNRRSQSPSRRRSPDRKEYYNRSRSRSNERHRPKDDSRNDPSTSARRSNVELEKRSEKNYANKPETALDKGRRRSFSKERRRSSSRDREHSKCYRSPSRSETYRSHYESDRRPRRSPSPHKYDNRQRKRSRSPHYKREVPYRDNPRYSKSQERRSRSPYKDKDSRYREYRKRSGSPYTRERYKSPVRKVRRTYSRSPPNYRSGPEVPRRPLPHYQVPPHFAGPWPMYEPIPPFVRFMLPEGYIPGPPPRFPGNMIQRPRMPIRLPVYNSRLTPRTCEPDTKQTNSTTVVTTATSSVSNPTESVTSLSTTTPVNTDVPSTSTSESNLNSESTDSHTVITTTQEIVKKSD